MLNKLKQKWMAFRDIFKDSNDINEKTVVGFASFAIMTIFAIVDLVTGYHLYLMIYLITNTFMRK